MLLSSSRRRSRQLDRLAMRARRGDARAFTELYRALSPVVMRFLMRRLGDRSEAEDLCAKCFERVVAKLESFEAERGCVEAWVVRIARNALIDQIRAQRPHSDLSALNQLSQCGPDPLERVLEGERLNHLGELLASCTAEERALLSLRYGDGLRHRAIAELSGLSEAAVRKRLSRLVTQLRQRSRKQAHEAAGQHPDEEVGYVY